MKLDLNNENELKKLKQSIKDSPILLDYLKDNLEEIQAREIDTNTSLENIGAEYIAKISEEKRLKGIINTLTSE